ncbi:poly(ADP-ribose) glycohydrolase [Balamuthia mandrillaris]
MEAVTDDVVLPCMLPSWPATKAALSGSLSSLDDLVALLKSVAVEKDIEPAFFEQYLAETADGTSDGSLSSASTLKLLPFIQHLALSMEDLFPTPVPLLRKGCPNTVTLSRLQVASILAHAFFCTWPQDTRGSTFPHINFDALFRATMGPSLRACKCLLHYFQRLQERGTFEGNIFIHRKVMDKLPGAEWWASSEKEVGKTVVMQSGSIEQDVAALYHADFANKLIGGGTLTGGSAQEEMLFLQKPECIVAMLLCEEMEANEAIVISGAEQFCCYSGKGRSKAPFSFGGDHNDATIFDPALQCLARHIVAVDATTGQGMTQYLPSNVLRDINKVGECVP